MSEGRTLSWQILDEPQEIPGNLARLLDRADDDGPQPYVPDGGRIEIVSTLEGLRALKTEWESLERTAGAGHHFFQTYAWNAAWANVYLSGNSSTMLRILTGRQGGKLVMLWPLMVTSHGPFRTLRWLTDPFGQYGDALVDPAVNARLWLQSGWIAIRSWRDVNGISLRHVRADANVYSLLSDRCESTSDATTGHSLDLRAFGGNPESYLASLERSKRSRIRKRLKAASKRGDFRFEIVSDGPEYAAAVRRVVSLKRQWLRDKGLVSPVVSDPKFAEFMIALGCGPQAQAGAAASIVSIDGAAVAIELGLRFNRHHLNYMLSFDPAYANLSPSKIEIERTISTCIGDGFERYDLMAPADEYKLPWTDTAIDVHNFVAANTLVGHLHTSIYLKHLRPLIKRVYRQTDGELRRRVVASARSIAAQTRAAAF